MSAVVTDTVTTAATDLPRGPYETVARRLLAAGYGPLPLPAGKKTSPPMRTTGRGIPLPSRADVEAWLEEPVKAAGNIGARLPECVVGIDVDDYAKPGGVVKSGAETMRTLTEQLGKLPRTVVSSRRFDTSPTSGIRLFRLPAYAVGRKFHPVAGGSVDVIQHGHRYIVTAPSVVDGQTYRLKDQRDPDRVLLVPPAPEDLPELPRAWVEHLLVPETSSTTTGTPTGSLLTDGLPDDRVTRAQRELVGGLTGVGGGRHDATTAAVATLVRLGEQGRPGVHAVLADGRERFVAEVSPDRDGREAEAGQEYDRMVSTAVAMVGRRPLAAPGGRVVVDGR